VGLNATPDDECNGDFSHDVFGAPFAVRDVSHLIGKILLAILTPTSIWLWVLLTRDTLRSQFR